MKTVISSGAATIPAGRIVTYADRTFALHARINGGGAPINETTGFALLASARGQVRVTARSFSQAVKLSLRSPAIEGNEDIAVPMGDSVLISRNSFSPPLRSVKTDKATGMGSTLDLDLILSNAAKIAVNKSVRLLGVARTDAPVDSKFDAYTEGDESVPVEFAESSAIPGKFLVSDANGKARYYDPAADSGAEILCRLDTDIIELIGGKSFVRVKIAIQPG